MGPIQFTLIKRLKSNNRFNYTPRYYNGKEENFDESQYSTKMDAYNETFNSNDFAGQWNQIRKDKRSKNNSGLNTTLVIIIAVLVFAFLYIIDFDLSIFSY